MTIVPFANLKAQYHSIKSEVDEAIAHVMGSGQFILGEEVKAFESEFADYCQARFGIAVNSGTSALHLALLAAGIGPGDEVITTPFTFMSTTAAILYTGARPVFVDIDPSSLLINTHGIEEKITSRTKAILPVHLYGQPADMDPIMEIAHRHNLIVIEDAAQAHGSEYKGRGVGSIGHMGCFSFYPSKNLGASGEGGAVVTNDERFASVIQMLRDWGGKEKNQAVLKGYNYRMEALQGAILRVKLRHLDLWTRARQAHAARYGDLLANAEIRIPVCLPNRSHVYHIYAVRVAKRDAVQASLKSKGIETGIHYPFPIHLIKAYRDLGYKKGDFPEAERASEEVLSLPMYPELSNEDLSTVSKALHYYYESETRFA